MPFSSSLSSSSNSMIFGGDVQPYSLSSDLEDARVARKQQQQQQQQHEDMIQHFLNVIGQALKQADETLSHLEDNVDLLPTAILRKSHEVAYGVGRLAQELEQHSPQEQQRLAEACMEDYNRSMLLLEEGRFEYGGVSSSSTSTTHLGPFLRGSGGSVGGRILSSSSPPPRLSVEDFLQAIQGASPLLRDIQTVFDELSEEDAEDIADATLTFVRLLLITLQGIHSTLTPQDVLLGLGLDDQQQQQRSPSSLLAEEGPVNSLEDVIVDEEEVGAGAPDSRKMRFTVVDDDDEEKKRRLKIPNKVIHSILSNADKIENTMDVMEELFDRDDDEKEEQNGIPTKLHSLAANHILKHHRKYNNRPIPKVKVLWPRLGPHVQDAIHWGQEEAAKRPLVAVTMGLTLWPAAIMATIFGGSIVLVDQLVQDIYEEHQDGPFLTNVEQGAAQVVQAGKLGWILSSVVTKQTCRVIQRQVKRHGGMEQIVDDVKEFTVDRITHPVETIGMVWKGLNWSFSAVTDTVQHVLQQREELLRAAVSA